MNEHSKGINLGFWQKLKAKGRPIMVMAPMADVTDAAFRHIIVKYSKYGGKDIRNQTKENLPAEALCGGGPDVLWTEFVSADGLCHPKGREKLLIDLSFTEAERPIVAQLFSGNPEKMYEACKLARELGFDGIDINMGCPDRSIEKSGAGASLIKKPKLAREIIRAAKLGAGGEEGIPVSVKTRLGYNKDELETWLREILAEEPAVVTVHARTRKEMSLVPARWERVARAVEIRNEMKSKTLIFGNGDVMGLADAEAKAKATGADGVMLGRAIFGNPYLFNKNISMASLPIAERLEIMLEHTKLFAQLLGGVKNFAIMKKHYKAYVNGFDGSKELRVKLMEAENVEQVEKIVREFLAEKKTA